MDPLTALSLAGNAIQLVQFGTQIVSKCQEIYKSTSGVIIENWDIEAVSHDFQHLSSRLKLSLRGRQPGCLTEDEHALYAVCEQCIAINDELVTYLNKLKVQGQGHRRWKSFQRALKSVWSKKELDVLTKRLSAYRSQMDLHLLLSLKMHQSIDSLQQDTRFNNLESTIKELISTIFKTCIHQVESSLLYSLRFPGMTERHEDIPDPHWNTFQWIFNDLKAGRSWPSFTDWLISGNGLYWVQGKPASGKSTLMRHIYDSADTWSLLNQWSNGHPFVKAGFFFWNSGTVDQRSQKGLLRSLLYQTLEANRELIPLVLPSQWQREYLASARLPQSGETPARTWALRDLIEAFKLLTEEKMPSTKMCFFIDGLDEYNGDHAEMAQLFRDIAQSPNIKICISSRSLVVFEDEFEGCPSLRLQDLTHGNITNYVNDRFSKNRKWAKLVHQDPLAAQNLVREIVDAADGVFLWVRLVVTSLLNGIGNRDETSDLQKRLRLLPSDLEKLYLYMLTNIDPEFYLDQASRIFQIFRKDREDTEILAMSDLARNLQPGPLTVSKLSLAYDDDLQQFARQGQISLRLGDIFSRSQRMSYLLRTRCAGLLELSETLGEKESHDSVATFNSKRVLYMHRTVRDFLEKPEIWGRILRRTTGTDFQPRERLLNSCIICLKIQVNNSVANHRRVLGKDMWANIFHAMLYAYLEDLDRGEPCEPALDELNRVAGAGQICRRPRGHWCDSCPLQFISPVLLMARRDNWFSLAVQFGLHSYLKCKARQDPEGLNKKDGFDLLEYGLLPTPSGIQCSTRIPIIVLLLECKTPRDKIEKSRTTWEIAFYYAQESLNKGNDVEEWLEILILFVQHGLFNKEWEICNLTGVSVWDFIDDVILRSTSAKAQTLRGLLTDPSAAGDVSVDIEEAKSLSPRNTEWLIQSGPESEPTACGSGSDLRTATTHQPLVSSSAYPTTAATYQSSTFSSAYQQPPLQQLVTTPTSGWVKDENGSYRFWNVERWVWDYEHTEKDERKSKGKGK
ncbi:hypothetical protein G7Y89_g4262 [Cudoniella acicularis]|uniref:NACHT domain-containing protein n=1 Tax=Cudoniella acicularis TaxID=354080 RepID=A0A8H4RRY5_9HELO|nr:hypothetical protein G7Y89_g4262 [Cudoniella acicularis]